MDAGSGAGKRVAVDGGSGGAAFLLLAGTGLATRALAREALAEGAATLAGCVAIFGGYALFTAYERSAFAELAGGLWMPLVLVFALRSRNEMAGRPAWRRALDGCAALAVVVAGAWLSNPTVGVMACYTLAAVALVSALLARDWAPVIRAAVAAPLGMGLAGIYLLPVAMEQGWADLKQVTLDPGQTLENNWFFARHADPGLLFHDRVLLQASLIAVAMVGATLCGVVACWILRRQPGERRWWIPLALIPAAVLFLQFPFSQGVWNHLPKLRYLQFPWRWLVVVEAPMGVFLASAMRPGRGSRIWRRWVVTATAVLAFAGLIVATNQWFFQPCDEQNAVPGMLALYRSGAGVEGQSEYVPPGADNELVPTGLPDACLVTDPGEELGEAQKPDPDADPDAYVPPIWDEKQGSCDATFTTELEPRKQTMNLQIGAVMPHAGYLILRRRSYPAWSVAVNGRHVDQLPKREDGLMAVPVPQGQVELRVDWVATPDVVAGRWVSLLSIVLLAGLFVLTRKLAQPRL